MQNDHTIAQFISRVAAEYNLAKVTSVVEMAGSTNRLWRMTTPQGVFALKELPYNDVEQEFDLRRAADFEAALIGQQLLLGPLPVPNRSGGYISRLADSRGKVSPVRLHQWFAGTPPSLDDPATLFNAGRTLRTIQTAGASWSVRPQGSLMQWSTEPGVVLEHFLAAGHFDGASPAALRHTVTDALALVGAGESMAGDWVYTHRDHKPKNCLSREDLVAVLDWDECNYCHPRLEAVVSALRWAGGSEAPNPERFRTFIAGYNEPGAILETLREEDFAKWAGDLLGWFSFQAGRALGEWPEVTEDERIDSAQMASAALLTLESSFTAIPQWTRYL